MTTLFAAIPPFTEAVADLPGCWAVTGRRALRRREIRTLGTKLLPAADPPVHRCFQPLSHPPQPATITPNSRMRPDA